MSKRPWPDNVYPTAEQLLEWCRTGMTAEVVPYLQHLIDDRQAMARVRTLRDKWREHVLYGVWNNRREYEHRVKQIDDAIATPRTEGTPL